MSDSKRISRVNELLRREIAGEIERLSFMDGACLVSVTDVKTSHDLKHAVVMISVMGGKNSKQSLVSDALDFLHRNRAEIQRGISKNVILKYTPVLRFVIDENIKAGDRILDVIRGLENDEN
jgi:ribosome-binding factor A